jgi:hypothetical protein
LVIFLSLPIFPSVLPLLGIPNFANSPPVISHFRTFS